MAGSHQAICLQKMVQPCDANMRNSTPANLARSRQMHFKHAVSQGATGHDNITRNILMLSNILLLLRAMETMRKQFPEVVDSL